MAKRLKGNGKGPCGTLAPGPMER